jgi:hypothetical protein
MNMKFSAIAVVIAGLLLVPTAISRTAADTLPAELDDASFWRMVSDFSEPEGYYEYAIITSNETGYQEVLPELTQRIKPDGVYLGVGPEQNFTYIAALRPKIAFIIDIRRDMMLEHLMYKAVFEMSPDRADFIANLFSIRRPAGLTAESSVETLFQRYAAASGEKRLAESHLKGILARLRTTHGFALSSNDERRIRSLYFTFLSEGVVTFYSSIRSPGYRTLMTMTDGAGKNWSFLASSDNYNRVRAMHQKNLIVPLVGDFGGPKTVRTVGQYVRDHGSIVSVFYLSNVEDYIAPVATAYSRNIATLPVDASSLFIRTSLSVNALSPWLTPIREFDRPRDIR